MPPKIKRPDKLKELILKFKKRNKTIAFTNGCFDILHYGHIKYLRQAKKTADILIVGLNSDTSVKRIKGPGRPINRQFERAQVLSELSCVDYITLFNQETPLKLIKLIKPDILIKGGDWKIDKIAGADFVKSRGGKIKRVSYQRGYSTTALIEKIRSG